MAKVVCVVIPMADAYEILTSRRHLRYKAMLADRLQENYRTIIMINDLLDRERFVLLRQAPIRFVSSIIATSNCREISKRGTCARTPKL